MNFSALFFTMLKLMIILALGWAGHRSGLFPEETQKVLTTVVLYVTAPCSIIYSALAATELPPVGMVLRLLGLSFLCYAVLIVLAFPLLKLLRIPQGARGVYLSLMVFSNCLFIGLPVTQSVFGSDALLYLAVFSLPFYPAMYILGVYLMIRDRQSADAAAQRQRIPLKSIINPCLIAGIIAILLVIVRFRSPQVITELFAMVNNVTTPCALFVNGIAIARQPLKRMLGNVRVYAVSLVRLVLFPVVVWLLLRPFVSEALIMGVALIVHAMPAAAAIPMLAIEYGSDRDSAVQGVFITTICCLITIPLLLGALV